MNIHPLKREYSWGEIIYKPQSTFGPRLQTLYQLLLVYSGEVKLSVDGELHHLAAGEVAFLWPGSMNSFQFSKERPTHHSWVHAKGLALPDPWESMRRNSIVIRKVSSRMAQLMKQLLAEEKPAGTLQIALYACLAEAMFLDFLVDCGSFLEAKAPGHPSIERALSHLNVNFRDECDLKRLGMASGLSQQHLIRLFRKETGMTPIRYLWQLREEEGLRLLRETGLTVSEIADACGFQNPYHFSRRISQRYGASPVALRKQYWTTG